MIYFGKMVQVLEGLVLFHLLEIAQRIRTCIEIEMTKVRQVSVLIAN